jgi:hypothetical protein
MTRIPRRDARSPGYWVRFPNGKPAGGPDHIQSTAAENVPTPSMFPNPVHLFHYIPTYVANRTQEAIRESEKITRLGMHLSLRYQWVSCVHRQPIRFTAPGTRR